MIAASFWLGFVAIVYKNKKMKNKYLIVSEQTQRIYLCDSERTAKILYTYVDIPNPRIAVVANNKVDKGLQVFFKRNYAIYYVQWHATGHPNLPYLEFFNYEFINV